MRTKIFGTFGPACDSEEILERMIEAGMTGMRLNLSHTTLIESKEMVDRYRRIARNLGVEPDILIDVQGPELRVGKIKEILHLENDTMISIGGEMLPVQEEVLAAIEVGDEILLDDGKILVQVMEKNPSTNEVVAQVLRGGKLQSYKSIKIVGKSIDLPALTTHDMANICVAKEYGVTALMQPFVSSGTQLKEVRSALEKNGAENVKIFAKIENQCGISNLEDILPEADVIVIARGDLGNDMPLWELPAVQKKIETECHKANKPYIVVTQMLASMEKNPVPTRAEVSDIFHAVYHGAWGVMLTGETAVGAYPVESIRYLVNTAREAEE